MLDLSYLVNSTVSSLTYLLATRAIGTLTSCLLSKLNFVKSQLPVCKQDFHFL